MKVRLWCDKNYIVTAVSLTGAVLVEYHRNRYLFMTNGNAKGKFEDSRATGIDVASDALASMRLKLLASTYVNSALRNSSSQIASAFKDNDNQIKEAASKNPGRKLEIYHKDAAPSEEWMTRALIAGTALTGISYITIDHNSKENELVVGLICVAVCFIFFDYTCV